MLGLDRDRLELRGGDRGPLAVPGIGLELRDAGRCRFQLRVQGFDLHRERGACLLGLERGSTGLIELPLETVGPSGGLAEAGSEVLAEGFELVATCAGLLDLGAEVTEFALELVGVGVGGRKGLRTVGDLLLEVCSSPSSSSMRAV